MLPQIYVTPNNKEITIELPFSSRFFIPINLMSSNFHYLTFFELNAKYQARRHRSKLIDHILCVTSMVLVSITHPQIYLTPNNKEITIERPSSPRFFIPINFLIPNFQYLIFLEVTSKYQSRRHRSKLLTGSSHCAFGNLSNTEITWIFL